MVRRTASTDVGLQPTAYVSTAFTYRPVRQMSGLEPWVMINCPWNRPSRSASMVRPN